MTIPQYKKWLESKIRYLRGLKDFENPDDGPYGHELIEEAYQLAIDLNLPECAQACKPPVTIGLLECLKAIPNNCSVAEAAEKLGVSKESIYAACKDGRMPHTRIGRRIVITPEQLNRYRQVAEIELPHLA